jgi:hypothetical protein
MLLGVIHAVTTLAAARGFIAIGIPFRVVIENGIPALFV